MSSTSLSNCVWLKSYRVIRVSSFIFLEFCLVLVGILCISGSNKNVNKTFLRDTLSIKFRSSNKKKSFRARLIDNNSRVREKKNWGGVKIHIALFCIKAISETCGKFVFIFFYFGEEKNYGLSQVSI